MALDPEEKKKRQEERRQRKYNDTHKEIDGIVYKKCSLHKEYFPNEDEWLPCTEEYFYRNKLNGIDGLHPYCRKCNIKKGQNYTALNLKKTKAQRRKWHRDNKEKSLETNRNWGRNNKEKNRNSWKNFCKNNPEKIKEYNKKHSNKAHTISKQEWEDCKQYFNNECAYCGFSEKDHKEIFKQQLHKEHIIDCGRSDLKNCIPSCRICNSEKHTTSFNDWYNPSNPKYDKERYLKIYQWIRYDCKKYIKKKKPKGKYVRKIV